MFAYLKPEVLEFRIYGLCIVGTVERIKFNQIRSMTVYTFLALLLCVVVPVKLCMGYLFDLQLV